VALGDPIALALGAQTVVMALGERPGLSAADSLGVYITQAPRIGMPDSARNCLSNIRDGGMEIGTAADRAMVADPCHAGFRRKRRRPWPAHDRYGAAGALSQPGDGLAQHADTGGEVVLAVSSAKSWLIPPIEGTNSIATGITPDRFDASCSAPDGIDRQRPGATLSAASASTRCSVASIGTGVRSWRRRTASMAHPLEAATSSRSAR
jgi:hypothetical protein